MGIRGLYNDLWTVTASPFTVFYWRRQGIFERKRFAADPLAGQELDVRAPDLRAAAGLPPLP